MFGLRPPFVHFVATSLNPALCRAERSIAHRRGGWVVLHPRGPRSGSSYAVSDRHHLIDPIRPTREHIAISPHGGFVSYRVDRRATVGEDRTANSCFFTP